MEEIGREEGRAIFGEVDGFLTPETSLDPAPHHVAVVEGVAKSGGGRTISIQTWLGGEDGWEKRWRRRLCTTPVVEEGGGSAHRRVVIELVGSAAREMRRWVGSSDPPRAAGGVSACLLTDLIPVASGGVARRSLPAGEGEDDPGLGGAGQGHLRGSRRIRR